MAFQCGCDLLSTPATRENEERNLKLRRSRGTFAAPPPDEPVSLGIIFHCVGNPSLASNYCYSDENLKHTVEQLNQSFHGDNFGTISLCNQGYRYIAMDDDETKFNFYIEEVVRNFTLPEGQFFSKKTNSFNGGTYTAMYSQYSGSDPIDQDNYINVWVCRYTDDGSGNVYDTPYIPSSGFAWRPDQVSSGNQFYRGIWLQEYATGSQQHPLSASDSSALTAERISAGWGQGSTAVHEFGHFLGLRHTWGSGTARGSDLPCSKDPNVPSLQTNKGCFDNDELSDLPDNTVGEDIVKPRDEAASCGSSNWVPYSNHMNYGDPNWCTNFHKDQASLMRETFGGNYPLWDSLPRKSRPINFNGNGQDVWNLGGGTKAYMGSNLIWDQTPAYANALGLWHLDGSPSPTSGSSSWVFPSYMQYSGGYFGQGIRTATDGLTLNDAQITTSSAIRNLSTWTIECWWYVSSKTSSGFNLYFFGLRDPSWSGRPLGWLSPNLQVNKWTVWNGGDYVGTVVPDTWHHVAITCSDGTANSMRVYINGVKGPAVSYNYTMTGDRPSINVATAAANDNYSIFDEVRMSQNVVYTQTFVPPKAPFIYP